ncbi:MAG: DUF2442 domain-containing protein [Paludibacteraceae bacterium]|nr:DUF2442 domain-containing protein [Paludibacteraceae bacterium]
MKLTKVWIENDYLYGLGDDGKTYRQSLLWYRRLMNATPEQQANYELEPFGVHWNELDEDISYQGFIDRNNVEPTALQRFLLTHRELNLAELAKRMEMNTTLLRNYIYGWKTPSKERENQIWQTIRAIGQEYLAFDR